jgi:amidase
VSKERFRAGLRAAMADANVDALIYPTWSNAPRLVGDLTTPAGDNSQTPSPPAGFPAITVPMGWMDDALPLGLQFLGDAWSEPRLIALAYAFEQATLHRRPPASTPPLRAPNTPAPDDSGR